MSRGDARADRRARSRSTHEDVFEVDGLLDLNDLWEIVEDPRLRGAARRAVDAGHPAARCSATRTSSPTCWPRCASGDILLHHPYDSFVDLGRALRRAGGRRPRRARDQADRVPHERRLAARPGADPRRRARQAGGLPGGAQGALRRAREHPRGRARWRRRACTSSTACRRSRRTPSASSSSAARATACATTCTSAPATTTRRPRACTPTSACSRATSEIGADVADMFNFLTGFARPRALPPGAGRARRTCATASSSEIERTIDGAQRAASRRGSRMKMNSLVDRALHPARSTAPRRPACRSTSTSRGICCLRPGVPGRVGEHPRRLDRRPLPRALADLRLRARRRRHGLHRLRRPDAAQPRHARRAARAGARPRRCAATSLDTLERCFADNTNAWELRRRRQLDAPHAERRRAPQRAARADAGPRGARP